MKYFNITVNGVLYQVSAEEVYAPGVPAPQAPGVNTPVDTAAPAPPPEAAPAAAAPASAHVQSVPTGGEGLLKAPMPGTIVAVEKAVGQVVSAGDVVIVLEAMKMENEIYAPRSGTISQIYINKGDTVSAGDPMLLIE